MSAAPKTVLTASAEEEAAIRMEVSAARQEAMFAWMGSIVTRIFRKWKITLPITLGCLSLITAVIMVTSIHHSDRKTPVKRSVSIETTLPSSSTTSEVLETSTTSTTTTAAPAVTNPPITETVTTVPPPPPVETTSPPPVPPSGGCTPLSSSGSCYRAGERCPGAYYDRSGIDVNGIPIYCRPGASGPYFWQH